MSKQASQPQRSKGPPPGWRYPDRTKHRSRLRGWLAAVWRATKDNAGLVSLVGVLLTLLGTTVLSQQEGIRQQEVAEQQAQQVALQTYLGDMGDLILRDSSPLPEASPDDEVSRLARAKTLTVLGGLGAQNKSILLRFLEEARLIQGEEGKAPIISLAGADLTDADLRAADLRGANLFNADLSGANLPTAFMEGADLPYADLRGANLRGANLDGADLSGADLSGADLSGADLSGADLSGAQGVTEDQLRQAVTDPP